MKKLLQALIVIALVVSIGLFFTGCKKDDGSTGPSAGGGLTANPISITVQVGQQATATINGGRQPYSIQTPPTGSIATAAISGATLTVTGVAGGSTSVTVRDSSGANTVAIPITVTTTGGGGYGSGTISSTSTTQGNLSFTGQGVFPIGAGPSVIAIYDTVENGLQVIGYQQVSGSNYNLILLQLGTPGGVSAKIYTIGENNFIMIGANIDTSQTVESLAFVPISGSITVTSVSGINVVGSFSINNAIRQSDMTFASFTGNFNVTYVRGRAIFGGGDGENEGPSVSSQHWPNEFIVHLVYYDPNKTVTSVSVTGPGISGSKSLTYSASNDSWNSWTSPSTSVSFGATYPTGLPFTYTFSITSTTGTKTATSTVSCFQVQSATNLSPTGTTSGTPTFSWTGINDPNALYQVQLSNNSGRIWNSPDVSGTSVMYTGPALTSGTTYYYDVIVDESSACDESSFAQSSFTYQ